MALSSKATSIDLFSFSTPQMRAFHMSWIGFFVCFFAWFADGAADAHHQRRPAS